jgi:hypothetical protein
LNLLDVFQNHFVAQCQRIAHAHFRQQFTAENIRLPLKRIAGERLTGEHIHDSADCFQLKILIAVEFDFHAV